MATNGRTQPGGRVLWAAGPTISDHKPEWCEELLRGELIERVYLCQGILNRSLTPRDELKRLSLEELRRRVGELEAERRKADEFPELLQESAYARAVREKERLAREDPGERYRYEARLKAIRDQHSLIKEATQRGREEGELN